VSELLDKVERRGCRHHPPWPADRPICPPSHGRSSPSVAGGFRPGCALARPHVTLLRRRATRVLMFYFRTPAFSAAHPGREDQRRVERSNGWTAARRWRHAIGPGRFSSLPREGGPQWVALASVSSCGSVLGSRMQRSGPLHVRYCLARSNRRSPAAGDENVIPATVLDSNDCRRRSSPIRT